MTRLRRDKGWRSTSAGILMLGLLAMISFAAPGWAQEAPAVTDAAAAVVDPTAAPVPPAATAGPTNAELKVMLDTVWVLSTAFLVSLCSRFLRLHSGSLGGV